MVARYMWMLFMKKVPRRARMVIFSPVFALWLVLVFLQNLVYYTKGAWSSTMDDARDMWRW